MKVLLTGSEGYIGSRLIQVLIKNKFEVTGLDTGYYKEGCLFDLKGISYQLINKDIRTVTIDDLRGFDAVVHLAELSNDPLGQNDPVITYEINHKGTMHLANVAKQAGVTRFIYFSSCSIYGASEDISTEITVPNPLTAYAKSKVMNEHDLIKISDDTFSPTILRNATVFGASPRMRFDLVVNDLVASAWVNGIINMSSDGRPWRPFVHILDVAQAVVLALNSDRKTVHNALFNVGSNNNNYQVRQIAEIIASIFPGCKMQYGVNTGDKRNYRVKFDHIQKMLPGFECVWDIRKGAQELKDIFAQVDLDKEMYQSRLYTRLKQIEYLRKQGIVDKQLFWVTST